MKRIFVVSAQNSTRAFSNKKACINYIKQRWGTSSINMRSLEDLANDYDEMTVDEFITITRVPIIATWLND